MRRSKRFARRSRGEPENLSDVAAWLYTDLLLGLAVIFIGGGAFLLRVSGPALSKGSIVQTKPSWYLSCNEIEFQVPQNISGQALEDTTLKAISQGAKVYQWGSPKPGLVQILGIDNNLTVANRDATRFKDGAVASTESLKKAKIITGGDTDPRKNPGNVLVRIFVVFNGFETNNGCKNN